MKKILTLTVLFIGILGLAACENDPDDTTKLTYNKDIDYYRIRTNQKVFEDALDEAITIISDRESLSEYFDTIESYYDSNELIEHSEQYDEEFFEGNTLIFITLHENSGSITHTLEQLKISDETLKATVNRIVGEIGTTDMAAWHMVIEYDELIEEELDTDLNISK